MAADDDEARTMDDELAALDDQDPSSGKRVKRTAAHAVLMMLADFKRRAAKLEGDALTAEFDRLVSRIVERHVRIVPVGLQKELREMLYEKLTHDPTLGAMLDDMRAAAMPRDRR